MPPTEIPPTAVRPTAIVTGASRGIGKASAIALAEAGFDVAITARTVRRGDVADDPAGVGAGPLPGSLEETAEAIEAAGGTAHLIPLDLGDRERLIPAAYEAIEALGRVDVLVNNAIHTGPGNYERFLDADLDAFAQRIEGNIVAQAFFTHPIVAAMVAQGGGTVMFMTSGAAYAPPFAMPGKGGWGFAYTVSKGGFHRMAIQLAYEYAAEGLRAFNVQPGFVATERVKLTGGPVANIAATGVEPAVVGAAVAHIAAHPDDFESGSTIQLQDVAKSLGLL
ncbi:MAG: SDR family NAD(P)-dependent oxidoreductase [Acidimicrobiales bacterium]